MFRGVDENGYKYIGIEISSEKHETAYKFAVESYKERKAEYLERMGYDKNLPDNHPVCKRIFNNILSGTCGEFATSHLVVNCENKNFKLIRGPDTNVYDPENKNYNPDMVISAWQVERQLHNKTEPKGSNYFSFLCTKKHIRKNGSINHGDPLIDLDISYNNEDYIAFSKEVKDKCFRFYGFIQRKELIKYIADPRNDNQKKTKKAFYVEDFIDKLHLPLKITKE